MGGAKSILPKMTEKNIDYEKIILSDSMLQPQRNGTDYDYEFRYVRQRVAASKKPQKIGGLATAISAADTRIPGQQHLHHGPKPGGMREAMK